MWSNLLIEDVRYNLKLCGLKLMSFTKTRKSR